MSIKHTQNYSVTSDSGGAALSGSQSEIGATEIVIDESYGASLTNTLLAAAFAVADVQSIILVSDKGLTLTTNGTGAADVQTISITGTPTGGTFALAFQGAITTALAYNASAANVQAALRALSTIGSGNVTCTGGSLPGTPIVCTFSGALAAGLQPLITTESGDLTGGTSPTVTVTHSTPGLPSNTILLKPGTPIVWSISAAYYPNPFTADVSAFYITTTVAARFQAKILTV